MNTFNWIPVACERPPVNRRIEWISPSGEVVIGKYLGGVIWMPEGSSVYVYYTPIYWRTLTSL